jgi:hypothetical protein
MSLSLGGDDVVRYKPIAISSSCLNGLGSSRARGSCAAGSTSASWRSVGHVREESARIGRSDRDGAGSGRKVGAGAGAVEAIGEVARGTREEEGCWAG